jgi:hypothetical protein
MKKAKIKKLFGRTFKKKSSPLHLHAEALQIELDENLLEDPKENDGLTAGRPFKTLALGQVSSRTTGEPLGAPIDQELINELVRVYALRADSDPVIIDWNHATSPYRDTISSPDTGTALGIITDLEARDDGLWATPAYNERGLEIIENSGGVLWSSPEYLQGPIYARDGGEKVGSAQMLAITLTPRPAQAHSTIDAIQLKENLLMDREEIEGLSPEDKTERIVALEAMIEELKAQIAEMKSDEDSQLVNDLKKDQNITQDVKIKDSDVSLLTEQFKSQQAQLLTENQRLSEELKKTQAQITENLRNQAVAQLLTEGKITPAQQSAAEQAYSIKDDYPQIWASFSDAQSIDLSEKGHSIKADQSADSIMKAVDAFQAEHSISKYSEALEAYAKLHPNQVKEILR